MEQALALKEAELSSCSQEAVDLRESHKVLSQDKEEM